jgi:hypothetical protein
MGSKPTLEALHNIIVSPLHPVLEATADIKSNK